MTNRLSIAFAGLTLALLLSSNASAAQIVPPSGECESPRDTVLQLLYHLQPDSYHPEQACACLDLSLLSPNEKEDAQTFAIQLKRSLDFQGLYVVLEDVPSESDYKDAESGREEFSYFPRRFPEFSTIRQEGKWMINKRAIRMAPQLYRSLNVMDVDSFITQLPPWAQFSLLGVHVWQLIACIALGILALLLQRLTLLLLGGMFRRMDVPWVQEGIKSIARPLGALMAAGVFTVFLPTIHFPVEIHMVLSFAARLVAVLSVVWMSYNISDLVCDIWLRKAEGTESKLDDQLVPLMRSFLKVLVTVFGSIFVLQNLNVDVGSLLAGLGIGGLAFALAAKDTIANLFGSAMIFIDRPFQVGDFITIGGDVEGIVEEVGFRTTRVRTFYKSVLTVPNANMTTSVIDNYSVRTMRRYKTALGLTYDTTAEQMTAFCDGLENLIQSMPHMDEGNAVVEFSGFGDSALEIMVNSFIDTTDYAVEMRTRHNLNLGILILAESLGVEFAYPTQTLHVESMAGPGQAPSRSPQSGEALTKIANDFGPEGPRFTALPQRTPIDTDTL